VSQSNLTALHPSSLLHVTDGKHLYGCLREALEENEYPKNVADEVLKYFYEDHLGILLRRRRKHILVGRSYYMEWIDAVGRRREIYGSISDCWDSLLEGDDKLTFTVRYDEKMRAWAQRMSVTKLAVPDSRLMSEELAWAGHVAWSEKVMGVDSAVQVVAPRFLLKWIVPGSRFKEFRRDQSLPCIRMVVSGYELCLRAQPSKIKNAGLGLFVKITNRSLPSAPGSSVFELPAGHLIDIGVYAPFTDDECKIEEVVVMKNFILNDFAEGYSFAKEPGDRQDFDLFDVSRDNEGALVKAAAENLLAFANETDGKLEVPSLVCKYDAEGAIHYCIGHDDKDLGPLRIPFEKDFELKIDYAESYEKVRVRKGYARVAGAKKKALLEACRHDEEEAAEDVAQWSLRSVGSCLRILEGGFQNDVNANAIRALTRDCFPRALIFAMKLRARVKSIEDAFRDVDLNDTAEYCDNGVSTMKADGTVELSIRVVKLACNHCRHLKSMIWSNKMLQVCVMDCLQKSENELMALQSREIRDLIMAL